MAEADGFTSPVRSGAAPVFLGTFAIVLAAIFLFLGFDSALAKLDRSETASNARAEYATGIELIAARRDSQAIPHFRAATQLDRDNPGYSVSLADAMTRIGRTADAEQVLTPILERNATDGAANLAMARLLAAEGRIGEAESYYHRAIYGLWPADAAARRSAARFELIDLLARTGAKQELLAELLPIEDLTTNDIAVQTRMAHLFVVAGSPARAVVIYRDLLKKNPRDPAAYLGLGEAALEMGNFSTARGDLREAARLSPADTVIASKLALADSLLSLDPTRRALSLEEQYRRSRTLLQRTFAAASGCAISVPPSGKAVLDSAAAILGATASANPGERDVEDNLSLSAALWTLSSGTCSARLHSDALLALLQSRIQQ